MFRGRCENDGHAAVFVEGREQDMFTPVWGLPNVHTLHLPSKQGTSFKEIFKQSLFPRSFLIYDNFIHK